MDGDVSEFTNIICSLGAEKAQKYAGQKVTLYVEYFDGTTGIIEGYFDNAGNLNFQLDKPGIVSVVSEPRSDDDSGNSPIDTGSKSPKTGIY